MTFILGTASLKNLEGVHPDLIALVKDVMDLQIMDFRVNEGVRSLEKQKEYVAKGVSKTLKSKHLIQPDGYGHAVDLYPFPVDMKAVNAGSWRENGRFALLAGMMLALAKKRGLTVVWGGDFDSDGEILDNTFTDFPHFELRFP